MMKDETKQKIKETAESTKIWCKDHKEQLKLGAAFVAGLGAKAVFGKAVDQFVDPKKGYYKLEMTERKLNFTVGDIWKDGKLRKSTAITGHVPASDAVSAAKWVLEKAGYEIEED